MTTITIPTKEDLRESELYNHMLQFSKWEIEKIRKTIHLAHRDKYNHNNKRKYGNLPRSMTDKQLRLLFNSIRNKEIRKQFIDQLFCALRIGEIKTLKFDFNNDIIIKKDHKTNKIHYLPLVEPYRSFKKRFPIKKYHTPAYLRKCFRAVRKSKRLGIKYAKSEDGRTLNNLTSQSLKHTGINIFRKAVYGDPFKICAYSGHEPSKFGSVGVYARAHFEEIREDLEKAFLPYKWLL